MARPLVERSTESPAWRVGRGPVVDWRLIELLANRRVDAATPRSRCRCAASRRGARRRRDRPLPRGQGSRRVGSSGHLAVPGRARQPDVPGASTRLRRYVLRRPPHGDVAAGSHDMGREFRVLSVLHKGFPLAPRAFVYCEDPAIIGKPFFVMERRRGLVVRREVPARFGGGADTEANRKLSDRDDRHAGAVPRGRLPRRRARDPGQARGLPLPAGDRDGRRAGSARRPKTCRSRPK